MRINPLIIFLILLPVAAATTIDTNKIVYDIQNNVVDVKNELNLDVDEETTLSIQLPVRYSDLSITKDNQIPDYEIEDNNVILTLREGDRQVILNYKTGDFLEKASKNFFIAEFENPLFSESILIEVKLPSGSILDKPIDQGKSVYPDPTDITSDGQRIIIRWFMEDVEEGSRMPILITYRGRTNPLYYVIAFTAIALIAAYLIFVFHKKSRETKKEVVLKEKIVEKPELHLKEDEKQIVRIIKQKGGQVEQGTLVTISDFSKAKTSQLLKELEERQIIKKVKKGKKNIIILKSSLLELE